MGQPVAVTEKPSSVQGIVRFELNRALTGMGHERFPSAGTAVGPTPAAELARRLFDTGQVAAVHVYSNIVTVELARGGRAEPLTEVMRSLYRYWQPGMKPPAFEDVAPAEEAAAPAAGGDGGDGGNGGNGGNGGGDVDPALAAAMSRVPAHLLERSRQARERWKAKQGG